MNDDRRRILAKIKALLAKVEGQGATEAEAATALAMARRLMEQYHFDQSEVEGVEWSTLDGETYAGTGRTDADFISPILADFFRVRVVLAEEYRGDSWIIQVKIFGDAIDVEVASWVYSYLADTYEAMWLEHRIRTRCRKDRRRAFYQGLMIGLHGRLGRERGTSAIVTEAGGTMPARAAEKEIDRAVKAAFPGAAAVRKAAFKAGDAMFAGMKRGGEINVARPVCESRPKCLTDERGRGG